FTDRMDIERWVSCEFPAASIGCPMPVGGAAEVLRPGGGRCATHAADGAPFGQGAAHTAGPTGGNETPMRADTEPRRSEDQYHDEARPVTAARMTLELLLAE